MAWTVTRRLPHPINSAYIIRGKGERQGVAEKTLRKREDREFSGWRYLGADYPDAGWKTEQRMCRTIGEIQNVRKRDGEREKLRRRSRTIRNEHFFFFFFSSPSKLREKSWPCSVYFSRSLSIFTVRFSLLSCRATWKFARENEQTSRRGTITRSSHGWNGKSLNREWLLQFRIIRDYRIWNGTSFARTFVWRETHSSDETLFARRGKIRRECADGKTKERRDKKKGKEMRGWEEGKFEVSESGEPRRKRTDYKG